MREREAVLRRSFSPGEQPPWIDVSGADPYRIVAVEGGFIGILRGSRAVVALGPELNERARVELPESPTALCAEPTGNAWIASRYGRHVFHVRGLESGKAELASVRELDVTGVSDLACGDGGTVYVLPGDGSDLLVLSDRGVATGRYPALPGGLRLQRYGRYLIETSLFERTVRVLALDARGLVQGELARIRHDGPFWAVDALERGSELMIALTGVENKPLVRAHGEFENIDSFAWIYRVAPDHATEQVLEVDTSDFGVIVPKALALRNEGSGYRLSVLGSGSGRMLRADLDAQFRPSRFDVLAVPPGASDAVFSEDARACVYPSPLLDAWISADPYAVRVRQVEPLHRPAASVRLGEASFFTELMAPENTSSGAHSRFTCETCHFEGGVDGRTHYTGRADVSVVTKPLFGLANNRPHFSRALDVDLSSVSHNEFRVAGAGSGTDPWFAVETARFPWLRDLGIDRATLSPLDLRGALLEFLYAFSHGPSAATAGRSHFSKWERDGALEFREHCANCHSARLFSDDATSEVPFNAWEALVFGRGAALVWASSEYAKVGVLPYVHERGTRVPSLRRLALKPRYFTNGSARNMAELLERFRDGPGGALHVAPPGSTGALSEAQRRALLAFLRLL